MYREKYLEENHPRREVAILFDPVFTGDKGDEIDWGIYLDLFQRAIDWNDRTEHCTMEIFDRFQAATVEAGGILTRNFFTGKIFWICQKRDISDGCYSCIYLREGILLPRFAPRELYALGEKNARALLKAAENNKGISEGGKVYLRKVINGKETPLN
ncbi:MAG: hypothetical protein WCQ96_05655 [Patescibacteria group bacterium]